MWQMALPGEWLRGGIGWLKRDWLPKLLVFLVFSGYYFPVFKLFNGAPVPHGFLSLGFTVSVLFGFWAYLGMAHIFGLKYTSSPKMMFKHFGFFIWAVSSALCFFSWFALLLRGDFIALMT